MKEKLLSKIEKRWIKDWLAENNIIAIHPGEVLKDELKEIGISQQRLAIHIGVRPKTINEICTQKRGISPEMAWKLSKALGGSPQLWLNLQNNWELSRVDESKVANFERVAA